MNGPPTPPSEDQPLPAEPVPPAAEETSAAVPAAQPENPPIPPEQSPYFQIFPQLGSLAAKGEYQELVQAAERADLNGLHDDHPTRLLVTAPLVLSYLILDDLPPARFALTRLPNAITALPLPQALFQLLASTWERRYENVYARAETLFAMAQAPELGDADFASVLVGLTTAFVDAFRTRTFALVSRAYTSIPLELAQAYLGLPKDQLLAAAEANKWTYDASTHILTPVFSAEPVSTSFAISAPSSLHTFDLVTDSVAQLET